MDKEIEQIMESIEDWNTTAKQKLAEVLDERINTEIEDSLR